MALVGEAHIVVRAITDKVNDDIRRGFSGASSLGGRAGDDFGKAFSRGFNKNMDGNLFSRLSNGIESMVPGAESAREAFRAMSAAGYAIGPAISQLISGISALIGSLGAVAGSAGYAAGALATFGNAYAAAGMAMGTAKLALGGIGKAITASLKPSAAAAKSAVSDANARAAAAQRIADAEKALARTIQKNRDQMIAANKAVRQAQIDLNQAIKDGQAELKQLGFDAEDAALKERGAALDLQTARKNLAAVQDLPPNNQARQAAELAYQQADLNYREAKSSAQDYAAKTAQAAKTGVKGTQAYTTAAKALADAQANQAQTARDNAQSQADAEDNLAQARKKSAQAAAPAAAAGGKDPFAGLNDAQIKFAKFLLSLKPKLDELKKTAAEAFLPPLQQAITIMVNGLFPTINHGVGQIGSAMGKAAVDAATLIANSTNAAKLASLFTTSAKLISSFGSIIGHVFGIVLSVLNASAPLTQHFVDVIGKAAKQLDDFLNTTKGKNMLSEYFKEAGRVTSILGGIIGNVFKGFHGIMKANFGPGSGGDLLLTSIKKATDGFAQLDDKSKQPGLKNYFLEVAKNTKAVFGFLGDIVKVFLKMGADPSVKKTFDILRTAVPYIGDLAGKTNDAGPALARMVVLVAKIFDELQDSGALKIFLDTLTDMLKIVDDFISSPIGNYILTMTGRLFAFTLAFTVAGKAGGFFAKVMLGDLAHGLGLLGGIGNAATGVFKIGGAFNKVRTGSLSLTKAMRVLSASTNPFVAGFGRIGKAAISGFGKAKGAITGMAKGIGSAGSAIGRFGANVGKNAASAASAIGRVTKQLAIAAAGAVKNAAVQLANGAKVTAMYVAQAAKTIAMKTAELAVAAARKIGAAAQVLLNLAMSANPIGIIIGLITILVGALIYFFTQTKLGQTIWANFTAFITQAFQNVVAFFQTAIQNIIGFFATWGPSILTVIAPVIGIPLMIIAHWNTIVDFFQNVWGLIAKIVRQYINNVHSTIANVINAIVTIWRNVWGGIHDFFTRVWHAMVAFYGPILRGIATFIANTVNGIHTTWNRVWRGIGDFFHGIWNGLLSAVSRFRTTFQSAFHNISGFVKTAFTGALGFVKGPINGIIDLVNTAIRGLNKLHVTLPGFLGGGTFGINLPTIPRLAKGGTVMPTSGGSIVNVAEAGRPERIEPLDRNGLSQRDKAMIDYMTANGGAGTPAINVTVNAGSNASPDAIAMAVSRSIAFQMRKGAA